MHLVRAGSLTLPVPPDRALPFFSPEGERLWVPGWDPVAHHAPGGSLSVPGAVFETAHGGETTLWMVLEFDRERLRARYARITPGSRLGTVEVVCHADGDRTRVDVRYELTSLAPAGEAVLAQMTEESYAAMLADWHRKVLAGVESGGV